MSGASAQSFLQSDIERGDIVYIQNDLQHSDDILVLTARLLNSRSADGLPPLAQIDDIEMPVVVRPLVRVRLLSAIMGHDSPISVQVLDASELDAASSRTPEFHVLKPPKYGELVWATQGHPAATKFSFQHIKDKKILYRAPEQLPSSDDVDTAARLKSGRPAADEAKHSNSASSAAAVLGSAQPAPNPRAPRRSAPLTDSFTFHLIADKVQPAEGELLISLQPPHAIAIAASASDILTQDYLLIAVVMLTVFILAVVIVACVMCICSVGSKRRQ